MVRPTLVIIPTTKPRYEAGFSAPLAWMFSAHIGTVRGAYGFDLTAEEARAYDSFIIELNWYLELHEFGLIVEFIKRHNPRAAIVFGGLAASLLYREVFDHYDVDYFIKGDNEGPMRRYLDGADPASIPNFVGRTFENETAYVFQQADYRALEFSLDWFPRYADYVSEHKQSVLPLVITGKGGCTAAHAGCEYCMGAQHAALAKMYARKPLQMDNESLMTVLARVDARFRDYRIYVLSKYDYDFSGRRFQGRPHIEIDSPITAAQIENIIAAFARCDFLLPVYGHGVMGGDIIDCREILELEDENHPIRFVSYLRDREQLRHLPEKNVVHALDDGFAPYWAHWDVCNDFDVCASNSRKTYEWFRRHDKRVFVPEAVA